MTTRPPTPAPGKRVFLICEPSVKKSKTRGGTLPNMMPLFAHGNVIVLLNSQDPRPISDPEGALTLIQDRLKDFNPAEDSLAWAGGDTVAAMLVGVALERRGIEQITWLRYDRAVRADGGRTDEGARYTPVPIIIYDGEESYDAETEAQSGG